MNKASDKGFFVSSVVGDLFTVEGTICSTRTADLYKGFDRDRMRPAYIWMLRSRFSLEDPQVQDFSRRLGRIATLGSRFASILTAGIDPSGVMFAVIAPPDGIPIGAGNVEVMEAERRFLSAVTLVDQLHKAGIVSGDLCGTSFWMNRNGEVTFVGIMGGYESVDSSVLPPTDTIPFLSPEQRTEQGLTASSDVYALGVLGYQLFTRQIPSQTDPVPVRTLSPYASPWIDDVILKCLDSIPNRRFANAGEVLSSITETKERILKEQSSVRERGTTSPSKQSTESTLPTVTGEEGIPEGKVATGLSRKQLMILGAGAAVVMASLCGGLLIAYQSYFAPVVEEDPSGVIELHVQAVNPQMREALTVIEDSDTELQAKKLKFEELAQSDDPLAHSLLVKSALETPNVKERILVEQSLFGRAGRLGLAHTGEAVQEALQQSNPQQPPPEYEQLLRVLDGTLPLEGRSETLARLFDLNFDAAVMVSTGMILDAENPNHYLDVIRKGLLPRIPEVEQISSPFAMLMASGKVGNKFLEQVFAGAQTMGESDTKWLLDYLVKSGNPLALRIATLATERRLYSPLKLVYLAPLIERDTLPEGLSPVLLRAVSGELAKNDVEALGLWLDEIASKTLFAICADDFPPEIRQEAIEYLAGRGISDPVAHDLLAWVKSGRWDDRTKLSQAIGSFGLADTIREEVLEERFEVFSDYAQDPRLFEILLQSPVPSVARVILKRFRSAVPERAIVQLLGNPEKEIRLAAVEALSSANEVGVLNAIVMFYEAESDSDVKAAYEKHLWVIKQRK